MATAANPPYWLVFIIPDHLQQPTPMPGYRESALAVAPSTIPHRILSQSAADVLTVAGAFAVQHPAQKVVLLGQLTKWLDDNGQTWASRGTDWDAAVEELTTLPILGMQLTLSDYATAIVGASAQRQLVTFSRAGAYEVTAQDRPAVVAGLEQSLRSDWAPYVASQNLGPEVGL